MRQPSEAATGEQVRGGRFLGETEAEHMVLAQDDAVAVTEHSAADDERSCTKRAESQGGTGHAASSRQITTIDVDFGQLLGVDRLDRHVSAIVLEDAVLLVDPNALELNAAVPGDEHIHGPQAARDLPRAGVRRGYLGSHCHRSVAQVVYQRLREAERGKTRARSTVALSTQQRTNVPRVLVQVDQVRDAIVHLHSNA